MSFGQEDQSARLQQGYNLGYESYNPGSSLQSIYGDKASRNTNLMQGMRAGWDARAGEGQQQQQMAPSFQMPSFENNFPSYETQLADQQAAEARQQAEYEARIEAQRVAQGKADTDAAYGGYLDAAGSAADFVNSEIDQESQNARLIGVKYEMTDDNRNARINDYFSTVWGEGDQSNLESLMGQFGNPKGFEGFTVERGTGGRYGNKDKEGGGDQVSTSKGIRPNIPLEEDEGLGAASSVLG
jgi:hypothetical protein